MVYYINLINNLYIQHTIRNKKESYTQMSSTSLIKISHFIFLNGKTIDIIACIKKNDPKLIDKINFQVIFF